MLNLFSPSYRKDRLFTISKTFFVFSRISTPAPLLTWTSLQPDGDWDCALLGYYATSGDNLLLTFRNNQSVPFQGSRILFHRRFRNQSVKLSTHVLGAEFRNEWSYASNIFHSYRHTHRQRTEYRLRRLYKEGGNNETFPFFKYRLNSILSH
jgi:hypothetical protein